MKQTKHMNFILIIMNFYLVAQRVQQALVVIRLFLLNLEHKLREIALKELLLYRLGRQTQLKVLVDTQGIMLIGENLVVPTFI
jgi:hypothetical protein